MKFYHWWLRCIDCSQVPSASCMNDIQNVATIPTVTHYVYTTCYSALVINIITTAAVDQIILYF